LAADRRLHPFLPFEIPRYYYENMVGGGGASPTLDSRQLSASAGQKSTLRKNERRIRESHGSRKAKFIFQFNGRQISARNAVGAGLFLNFAELARR
jgi:hypothetical protein